MSGQEVLTLLQLNQRIAALMRVPATQNVWVTAELSDVNVRGGHCYMELLEKDDAGRQVAKARGVIWANIFPAINGKFQAATGQPLATGLKVMLRVSAGMHPVFGFSLQVTDVNPEFTMGDLLRRRREIIERLTREGVINLNRELTWPDHPYRIAVISARGAAGYGDFINQLYSNPQRLRFVSRLFPAVMQGEKAARSIMDAMDRVAAEADSWDCVVIIRGGGATSDLQCFEDYELAASVAQFPIPVVIGIGHERDITVLDWVANMRVKTPTAAAEMLVRRADSLLQGIHRCAAAILQAVTDRISGCKEQLGYLQGTLQSAPTAALGRADTALRRSMMSLSQIGARRIAPALERLSMTGKAISTAAQRQMEQQAARLEASRQLLEALSPAKVLARGYSITRDAEGRALTDASRLAPGDAIVTILADGTLKSSITSIQ